MAFNKKTDCIALMCGHGKSTDGSWDPGCVYDKHTEAGQMLRITKAAVRYLRKSGYHVLTDADHGNNRNMISDVCWANGYRKYKVKMYLSIHCDYSGAPSGTAPLYLSSGGKRLAKAVDKSVRAEMGMRTRGLIKRKDLYELTATDMPACIYETGSIKYDLTKFRRYDKYGEAIAKGIMAYLKK